MPEVADSVDPRAAFLTRMGELGALHGSRLGGRPSARFMSGRANVSPTTVGNWLKGARLPDTLDGLLVVIGCLRDEARTRGWLTTDVARLLDEEQWREHYQDVLRAHAAECRVTVHRSRSRAALGGRNGALETPEAGAVRPRVQRLLRRQAQFGERLPYHLAEGRMPFLSAVYVRQTAGQPAPSDGRPRDRRPVPGPGGQTDTDSRSVQETLKAGGNRLLVQAGPGGGKSTLVAQLALELGRPWVNGNAGRSDCVPVWANAVSLAEQPDFEVALDGLLASDNDPDTGDTCWFWEREPAPGAAWLVMVDGLDEIVDPVRRRSFLLDLALWAREVPEHSVRILLTSRHLPAHEQEPLTDTGFTPYVLQPFKDEQAALFFRRWFDDDEALAEFLRQVRTARLQELMQVPLLATITSVVHQAWPDQQLPNNRYALYEQYRAYLSSMRAHQVTEQVSAMLRAFPAPHAQQTVRFLESNVDQLVAHLAVRQTSEVVADLSHVALAWLAEQLGGRARATVPGWGSHVSNLLTSTGLLVRAGDSLRFLHASFAEHLAAESKAGKLPPFDPTTQPWEEVLHVATREQRWNYLNTPPAADISAALQVLVHYAHHHPTGSRTLLTWLQRGPAMGYQFAAAYLMAEGCSFESTHVETLLWHGTRSNADLPQAWWRVVGRIPSDRIEAFLVKAAEATHESHTYSRVDAVEALMAANPARAAPLLRRLADEPGWRSLDVLRMLASLGPAFRDEAIRILTKHVQATAEGRRHGELEEARQLVAWAPKLTDVAAASLRAELLPGKSIHPALVASQLAQFGAQYLAEAATALRRLVHDECDELAAYILSAMPGYGQEGMTALHSLASRPQSDMNTRLNAIRLLGHKSAEEAATVLRPLVTELAAVPEGKSDHAVYAASLLAGLGPECTDEAAHALRALLEQPHRTRRGKGKALAALGVLSPEHVPEATRGLHSLMMSEDKRGEIKQAHGQLRSLVNTYPRSVAKTLREILDTQDIPANHLIATAQLLHSADPHSADHAADALRRAVNGPHDYTWAFPEHMRAMAALGALGSRYVDEVATGLRSVATNMTVPSMTRNLAASMLADLGHQFAEEAERLHRGPARVTFDENGDDAAE